MNRVYEEEILAEEEPTSVFYPIVYVFQFLAFYGWYIVGAAAGGAYVLHKVKPAYKRWREAREDAAYHKDDERVMARLEAERQARERQQRALLEASERAKRLQEEREEKKRAEAAERLAKYGVAGGRKLGTPDGDGYLPLSGGASTSSYRPAKRSACSGGGCGR